MNIFILDSNPTLSAQYHVDKHIVKMGIELCQLLSTAHRQLDGFDYKLQIGNKTYSKRLLLSEFLEVENIVKKGVVKNKIIVKNKVCYLQTHVNHPSAKWVRESSSNYFWTFKLFLALLEEYTYRFGKIHKSMEQVEFLKNLPKNIPIGEITTPKLAMNDEYKIISEEDSTSVFEYGILNYQNYYREGKSHLHQWKNREKPYFIY